MAKIVAVTPDCTNRCRSTEHGDIITSAITKRDVLDEDLCSYLNYICCCCENVRDSVGRIALHMASSCGRTKLIRWLVESRYANVNSRDEESGYTPLHRSVFYGKLDTTVELMKLGANLGIQDADGLSFLEHTMMDGTLPYVNSYGGELYTWGTNSNNSLGPQQSRTVPEILDVFHKRYHGVCVKQICLSQFHSVIVTASGTCFSCGHGQGGRLGLGIEHTEVTPKQIHFPEKAQSEFECIQCSISRDHSIFVTSEGNIYACGLNTHKVLGISPPPTNLLVPKQLKKLLIAIKGVCAAAYHSLAWGPSGVYTWGLNAGQLGHQLLTKSENKYVIIPKLVKSFNYSENQVKLVCVSNGATVVYTDKGDIYVLYEYQCKRIASRQLNLVQISAVGGKLNSSLDPDLSNKESTELKVAVLTNTGNLYIWQELDPLLLRCIFSINRALVIRQLGLNMNGVIFVTKHGEAYKGSFKPRKKKVTVQEDRTKSEFHKFLERDLCVYVKLQKFPRICRGFNIQSDMKGENFCVIQENPYRDFEFPDIAPSSMSNNLKNLIDSADESDNIHDVIFELDEKSYCAHKYVISYGSPYLAKLITLSDEKTIHLNSVNPIIFEQLLEFIYSKSCDLTSVGEIRNSTLRSLCKEDSEKKSKGKIQNPVRMLHEMAKRFEVNDLQKVLSNLDVYGYCIKVKQEKWFSPNPMTFSRLEYTELYDVKIVCKDGHVINAHKCILTARLEYFANMFSTRWHEGTTSQITLPFPEYVVSSLLQFIYTDSLSSLDNRDIDQLFRILILADQLFVIRLKEQCEMLLTKVLTLKNAVRILSLADIYNAEKLKFCSIRFIVSNITAILELRTLDDLELDLLEELSKIYFESNPRFSCRVITPYSTAVSDDSILQISSQYPINLEEKTVKTKQKPNSKRRIKTSKTHIADISSSSLEEDKFLSTDNDTTLDSETNDSEELVILKPTSATMKRLNAISWAKETISNEEIETKFRVLSKKLEDISFPITDDHEFPLLHSPSNSSVHKSTPKTERHKITRISQKQRKRLSSQSSNHEESGSPVVPEPPKNPWKIDSSPSPYNSSLNDNIEDIMLNEKKQKENLIKIQTKLLSLTQIEDKAIDELKVFYNVQETMDEIITIERVAIGAVAAPVWVPNSKSLL